jgi:SecD/SecF fusion protein
MYFSKWQRYAILGLCFLGALLAVPNLLPKSVADNLPGFLPSRQISLGLDLRGGSYILLEIDSDALMKDRLEVVQDDIRGRLRAEKITYRDLKIVNKGVQFTLTDPNDAIRARDALKSMAQPIVSALADGTGTGGTDMTIDIGTDGAGRIGLTDAGILSKKRAAIQQSIEIVRRRVDQTGVTEPSIQAQGAERILVQLPGVGDPKHIVQLIGTTAKMTFRMVNTNATDPKHIPADSEALALTDRTLGQSAVPVVVYKKVEVSGENLVDAQPTTDGQTGQWVVSLRFDRTGARKFADLTAANVGRPFAVVLDNKVITAPVIQGPIPGGTGQISGRFTAQSANDLAVLLRAGALPAPLTVIEERTVGPDLGADAIRAGLISVSVGLVLVMVYMSASYGIFGHFANIALVANLIMILGLLSALGATLTLPGIAGILLTLGMAVDANVLINERIREEVKLGKKPIGAIEAGFSRAFATIMDANLTTLIKMALLFWIGTGPVRGFAVTISLGILTSVFTATSLVRLIVSWWYARVRPTDLAIQGPKYRLRLVSDSTNITFMGWRNYGLGFSAVLSILSLCLLYYPGLNLGIDFKGGILIEARTQEAADFPKLRGELEKLNLGQITLQEFGSPRDVLIRVGQQPGPDAAQQKAANQIRSTIEAAFPGAEIRKSEAVGATVSNELFQGGMLAMGLAIVAMLLYIWFRFEWQFGVGAVATLILDVTKTMGFFVLFQYQFNLVSIAAILTIMGWSINDKVVVYDRVRENLRKYKSMPLRELIDRSINETLNRTINVSATIFLATLPLVLFGGEALRDFSEVMLFGIALGTSSSIFIAAPILLLLGEGRLRTGKPVAAKESKADPAPAES